MSKRGKERDSIFTPLSSSLARSSSPHDSATPPPSFAFFSGSRSQPFSGPILSRCLPCSLLPLPTTTHFGGFMHAHTPNAKRREKEQGWRGEETFSRYAEKRTNADLCSGKEQREGKGRLKSLPSSLHPLLSSTIRQGKKGKVRVFQLLFSFLLSSSSHPLSSLSTSSSF